MKSLYERMYREERRKFYWDWEVKTQDLMAVFERAGLKNEGYGQWYNDIIKL